MAKTGKDRIRKEAQLRDKSVTVELPNPTLVGAFGDPFMLQNFRFDEDLYKAMQTGAENAEGEDVEKDDPRIQPLVHADLAYTIEFFLRARDPKSREHLVVGSQTDADHIHDLGEALQIHRKEKPGTPLLISKSDHRWVLQKAKDLAYKAFPIDSRMFIDHLDIKDKEEETPAA